MFLLFLRTGVPGLCSYCALYLEHLPYPFHPLISSILRSRLHQAPAMCWVLPLWWGAAPCPPPRPRRALSLAAPCRGQPGLESDDLGSYSTTSTNFLGASGNAFLPGLVYPIRGLRRVLQVFLPPPPPQSACGPRCAHILFLMWCCWTRRFPSSGATARR